MLSIPEQRNYIIFLIMYNHYFYISRKRISNNYRNQIASKIDFGLLRFGTMYCKIRVRKCYSVFGASITLLVSYRSLAKIYTK